MTDRERRMSWVGACVTMLMGSAQLHAADVALTIRDYSCRGFAPDLVQYRVEGIDSKKAGDVRLFDAEGGALPVQWEADPSGKGGTVSFVTSLAHDAAVTNFLSASGRGAVAASQLTVHAEKDKTVLANGLFSVTTPAPMEKTYDPPVQASLVSAPILAFTSGKSGAMGASKILTDRLVKTMRVWLAARGPVYADLWYELAWAEGGFYRCRVRVIDGVPLAQVMEEYDLGKLDGRDFWELSLTQGWQPDQVEKATPWGNGTSMDRGSVGPLDALAGQSSLRMSVDNGFIGHLGVFRKEQRAASPNDYPMAGVVVLRKGEWRRVNVLDVQAAPHEVRIRFPMSARDVTWQRDSASVSSPFSTHSFDPSLPPTYGRRHWGLMLSAVHLPKEEGATAFYGPAYQGFAEHPYAKLPPFSRARCLYGIVTLDQYKNYVLDWSEGAAKYPLLSASNLPPPAAARDPQLKKLYDLYLRAIPNFYMSCPTPTHHATGDNYLGAWLADSLLAAPDLTAEQRRDIRARLALILYLHGEPGVLSYGIGSHPGNPNMPLARFFPGVAYLGLLPDHPMRAAWADFMSRQSEYELGKTVAPGGAWLEYGAYHFHGFRALPMMASIALAKPANADRIFDYVHTDLDYVMNLLSAPDPRYRARMIPGLANSGPCTTSRLVEGAQVFQERDPDFAAQLLWAWKENNSKEGALPVPVGLEPKTAPLSSRLYPGLGVIFRAHQGPQETWMLLRSGFLWSHWNIDPGHFVMASRGAVLVPFQAYQYGSSPDKAFDICNTVRFGAPENQMPYGWPDGNVLDYFFGASVDYAWSSTGVPDWFIEPAASEPFRKEIPNRLLAPEFTQQQGAFQWDRQVLFLKGRSPDSPNYFVFRDSTRGAPSTGSGQGGKLASYLNMNLLGRKTNLKVDGTRLALDTEWPVKLDILFAKAPAAPALFEANENFQLAEVNTPASLPKGETPSRDWLSATGSIWRTGTGLPAKEQRVLVRIPAAPEEGYFYVVYPRAESEAPPVVKRLADGILAVTHREGTDYVLLSSLPVTYEGEGVRLEGCAGAVRLGNADVTLVLAGGSGRVGYKGHLVEGAAPFEKKLPLSGLAAGTEKPAVAPSRIVMPAFEGGDDVAPGLKKRVEGEVTRYRVSADRTITAASDAVRVEGRDALVEVAASGIRFVVPDRQYARLSVGGVGVRGLGPFDLTFTPTAITGKVDGVLRSLVTTWPEKIVRPMVRLDGRAWCAGWADDPCIGKTADRPQFSLAFGVLEGAHAVEVGEWQFPAMPPTPPEAKVILR